MSESLSSRKVLIDPRGDILWRARPIAIHGHEGTLFTSPEAPRSANDYVDMFTEIDTIEAMQHQKRQSGEDKLVNGSLPYSKLGHGAHGTVYAVGGRAVKSFAPTRYHGHLSELRATVMLAEGLRKLHGHPAIQETDFSIRGVDIEAAYIPQRHGDAPHQPYTMWAMEQIHPVCDTQHRLTLPPEVTRTHFPSESVRTGLYHAAHRLFDMPPDSTNYDDKLSNLLIEALPGASKGSIVKIDIQTRPGALTNY